MGGVPRGGGGCVGGGGGSRYLHFGGREATAVSISTPSNRWLLGRRPVDRPGRFRYSANSGVYKRSSVRKRFRTFRDFLRISETWIWRTRTNIRHRETAEPDSRPDANRETKRAKERNRRYRKPPRHQSKSEKPKTRTRRAREAIGSSKTKSLRARPKADAQLSSGTPALTPYQRRPLPRGTPPPDRAIMYLCISGSCRSA